jgi:hypothetical protein
VPARWRLLLDGRESGLTTSGSGSCGGGGGRSASFRMVSMNDSFSAPSIWANQRTNVSSSVARFENQRGGRRSEIAHCERAELRHGPTHGTAVVGGLCQGLHGPHLHFLLLVSAFDAVRSDAAVHRGGLNLILHSRNKPRSKSTTNRMRRIEKWGDQSIPK